jgi:hypothetical protein
MRPPKVYASGHAIDRARERYGLTLEEMLAEVYGALREGRIAVNKPRWLIRHGSRTKTVGRGKIRYVWNEQRTRVYTIKETGREEAGMPVPGEKSWCILTCLHAA